MTAAWIFCKQCKWYFDFWCRFTVFSIFDFVSYCMYYWTVKLFFQVS